MTEQPIKWYNKPQGIIILLILFFPIGLYLMWKNQIWSKQTRWIVSIAFAVIVIANPGKNGSSYSSNKCMMDGCDRDGIGWHHDLESAELRSAGMYGAYKIHETGGYCSRDHAYEDNKIKRVN